MRAVDWRTDTNMKATNPMLLRALPAMLFGAIPLSSVSAEAPVALDNYQVTASRTATTLDVLPASVTIINGDDLRVRGAQNLTDALAGIAGVEISPSGDNGPAGSVPAFWGLREFDAFLLVVDGVPAGGAFNPALTTLDLNNVERIEVMRGAAPVMYGATSFVGVIHVIHFPAGQADDIAWARLGGSTSNPGSFGLGMAKTLDANPDHSRSMSASIDQTRLADDDASYLRALGLYRTSQRRQNTLHWRDYSASVVHQKPESPVVLEDDRPTNKTPQDANHNPADATFDEVRLQMNVGSSRQAGETRHVALTSVAVTGARVVRGFLEDPDNPPPNADGYKQSRGLLDIYTDRHVDQPVAENLRVAYGADALVGAAGQKSEVIEYTVALDGRQRPNLNEGHTTKEGESFDGRAFVGGYVQADWRPHPRMTVLGGLRLNLTHETRKGEREEDRNGNGVIDKPAEEFEQEVSDTRLRLTGTLGMSWALLRSPHNRVTAFANYRNSFKPAAFEFAPEIEAEILKPETADSIEAGIHTNLFDGLMEWELAAFYMDFKNVLVAEAQGVFNVGATRLRGAETELNINLSHGLHLLGSYAIHDTQYLRGTTPDGQDLGGNELPMSPREIAAAGLVMDEHAGIFGNALINHVGARFLDNSNEGRTSSYNSVDATLGYHRDRWTIKLIGHNLTDEREPISQSEFSEVATTIGPEQQPAIGAVTAHYLSPARSVMLELQMAL